MSWTLTKYGYKKKNIYIKIKKGKKDLKIFALIYKTRVAFLKYLFFLSDLNQFI